MKQLGKLRRGFLLMLCVLCLVSACAVHAYAEDPAADFADPAAPAPPPATVKCTTPSIGYKYFGDFEVAVIIYYNSTNTNMITVTVNGRTEQRAVPSNGTPLILGYHLQEKTSLLISAVAMYVDPSNPPAAPTHEDSDPALLAINGYAVPYSTLRVSANSQGVNKFSDVPAGAWYRPNVDRLVRAGAIEGMDDTTFAPDGPMTVAQYLKVLLASMYRDEMINAYYSGSTWYDPYFEFSALSVNEDGFLSAGDADREISRYEMAVLLARAYKMYVQPNVYQHALSSANSGSIGDFDKIPEQYREAVLVCYYVKMLEGMDDAGSFFGDTTLTRCQACATVVRLFNAI